MGDRRPGAAVPGGSLAACPNIRTPGDRPPGGGCSRAPPTPDRSRAFSSCLDVRPILPEIGGQHTIPRESAGFTRATSAPRVVSSARGGHVLDILIVFVIIGAALVLFATEKLRADVVAILILATLMVIGLFRPAFPTPDEAISGFANRATVTIGAMFILTAGLVRTGAIDWVSRQIMRATGRRPRRAFLTLLATVGCFSAFVNNTAALAVFLPITLTLARQIEMSPSKMLMPLSFVAMTGGMCTLIGTSTNIIVSEISATHGLGAFPMFELTKLGVVFFVVGVLYAFLVVPRILPARIPLSGLTGKYRLANYLSGLEVNEGSPVVGKTPAEIRLSERYDVNILQIIRGGEQRWFGLRDTYLEVGDRLLVRGDAQDIVRLKQTEGLTTGAEARFREDDIAADAAALVEVVVTPSSSLVGQTLRSVGFRQNYRVFALALRKHGRTIRRKIADIRLDVGDTLLIQGRRRVIDALRESADFLILQELDVPHVRTSRVVYAVATVAGVVGLAALGVMPIVVAAVVGSVFLILTGCLSLKDAYESIDWMVIFLLAGLIPLGIAMERTGAAEFLVSGMLQIADAFGPVAVVSAFYLITSALTAVMSNNATAILLAPIGIGAAAELGLSPWPFLMAITFGASAAFSTPVGYQTNLMVYSPGGYRYSDYVRAGLPLNLIFWIIATVGIPMIWSF